MLVILTSSFTTLVRRLPLTTTQQNSPIRDTRPDQTTTQSIKYHLVCTFESVVDKTKTLYQIVP